MPIERERRYVVTGIDPDIGRCRSLQIEQGYFQTPDAFSLRIRIIDDTTAILTRKEGKGVERFEEEHEIPVKVGRFLMRSCRVKLRKTRFLKDGWEVDYFDPPLGGLVIAEREHEEHEEVVLPDWIKGVEVTDSLTNLHLAHLAHDLGNQRSELPIRELVVPSIPRIVLTGGPCAGKSSLMKILPDELQKLGIKAKVVPEAATIVFGQIGIRPGTRNGEPEKFQRDLYRVIRVFEEMSVLQAAREGAHVVVFDRGCLDGAAYLDGGITEFERLMMTTVEHEFSRYTGIVFMAVAPEDVYERVKINNPQRTETYEEAIMGGNLVHFVYSKHPGFRVIKNPTREPSQHLKEQDAVQQILSLCLNE